MKPPVRVWVVSLISNGQPIDADTTRDQALDGYGPGHPYQVHRYRLDTPKPRTPPSRLPVAGGVVRKKRKSKRGRKS